MTELCRKRRLPRSKKYPALDRLAKHRSERGDLGMKIRYVLLGLFACFEAANFSGFSWTRLQRLSDEELINVAIRYNYPDVYADLKEFKADYASFNPEVHYWTDLTGEAGSLFWNKFFGFKWFNVRLPDAVVVVTANGFAQFSRGCSENRWCSPTFLPDHPVLGIVGTVQDGPPNYEAAREFSVRWVDGSEGSVFISGHCFAALSHSQKPVLRISVPFNHAIITIGNEYGYRLIAIKDIKQASYSRIKIAEQEFARSQDCDPAVRAAWPNVGGASWKR
jgi:hypothetical protein